MKKKKILIVMMNLYNGGAEKSLVNFLNELDESKYDIDLLLFQKKGLFLNQVPSYVKVVEQPRDLYLLYNNPSVKDLFKFHNIKLIFLRVFYTILMNVKYKNYLPRVRRQIRWDKYYKKLIGVYKKKYDVSLSYLENEPMRYVIDKTVATKKYVWLHNDYIKIGLLKENDEYYYDRANKIVTISKECLNVFNRVFPKFKEKSIYIPNISSSKTINELAKKPPKILFKENVFKIVSIGRLCYEKGFDIAIDAAKILKENNINYQWYIIGDGVLKNELMKKIKSYGLSDNLALIGVTDNPYSYIKSSDIFVQTSRSEGKAMVLDEAKILNKPFVVTKYPTVLDQANEKISLMVEISAEDIAKGIMYLYKHPDRIKEMEENMKKEINSNEKEISKYHDLLDE